MPLGSLLRGGPPAQSLLRADLRLDVDIPHVGDIGPDERAVLVDEWDRSAQRLRPGWCKVYPTALGQGSQDWAIEALGRHHRLVQRLHQRLLRRREALRAQPRQLDGEEVDLDALLTAYGDTLSGHSPEPRWYQRMARRDPDTATLVLMDLSLSTDSWVQDRRVLDVCREAVLVLGELSERMHERLRVMAFASQTRNQVRAWDIKTWEDPWMRARGRLGMLKPQGYTRIGPALRYAASELKKVRARRRVLLLLSDGKPTDYDRYEGRYGLADVGHAIRQARGWGLRVHALAVAEHAQETLPAMMGPGGYTLLPRPEALLEALVLLGR